MTDPVLSVDGLSIDFPAEYGEIGLVRGVSFDLHPGECLGVVGESGSGKSLLSLTLMGLQPSAAVVRGSIQFDGRQLVGLGEREFRGLRGSHIAMIYQDALVGLNPGMRVRAQLRQATQHTAAGPAEMLEAVKIRDVDRAMRAYPHELSGGQRQRVLIAMAIAGRPRVVIADEPTTALDVTVQSQVLALINELRRELGFGLVFVSHDLGLVSRTADHVAVMYAGEIMELGATDAVLSAPSHPYTNGLLESSRSLEEGRERLVQIPGTVPTPGHFSQACRFAPRCSRADDTCVTERPILRHSGDRLLACHHPIREDVMRLGTRDA